MSTISSIASSNMLIANLTASGKLDSNKVDNSTFKVPSTSTTSTDKLYSTIQDAYTNGQKYINTVSQYSSKLSELVKSYDQTKSQFQTEYASNLFDLNEASSKMQKRGFYVKGADDEETAKNVKDVVSNVTDFVKSYNENQKFLNKNSEVSKRVASLANSFADNKYFARTLNNAGISVEKDGTLSVDSEKLSKALTDNNSSASYALEGLAKRTDNKTVKAANQMDKVFPSISEMMGSDYDATKKLYSANTLVATSKYDGIGTMLSLYF